LIEVQQVVDNTRPTLSPRPDAETAENAVRAVDLMFDSGGGSAIYQTSRLERCFRDVHMITHHICASQTNVEMAGQYFLGGRLQVRR
jgi:indole-3-acetate monooxygenase